MMREAQSDSLVGTVVEERYRIEAELGQGAMGAVYRGRHIKVGRTVAIKVLHEHLVVDPAMVERFEREAKLAARLKHKNLVSVIDIGTTPDGKRMMVLEFAPGTNMADLVTRPMARARVIDLTRQLLLGLEHAHRAGLVHRDLKPDNVLVERTAEGKEIPRIVDFGIAVLRDTDDSRDDGRRLTTTGVVMGTPMYMSPEQARGEDVDHRTDLFALGVMVFEMLAGVPPFEGSGVEIMMQNLVQDPPSIATRTGGHVDPRLEAFARKLMAREVADRFASASEALAVLDEIALEAVPEPVIEKPTLRERVQRISMKAMQIGEAREAEVEECAVPPRRRRWGTAVGAAAIAAGLAAAFALGVCVG